MPEAVAPSTAAVVGVGAVGGLLAGALQQAGHRVLALTSPNHRRSLADEGFTVHSPRFGDIRLQPEVVDRLEAACDVIFLCVKAYQLDRALSTIEPDRIGSPTVVPLLNGLEHMALLRRTFEPSLVLAGSIGKIEVKRSTFDVVVHSNSGGWIGLAGSSGRVEIVENLLRSVGFDVEVVANESTLLWQKLVRLAPLACLTAASGLTLGQVRRTDPWRAWLEKSVAETAAVARAHGVELSLDASLQWIAGLPGHISTSMARDIEAGRPSELDAIAGAVQRAAAVVGLDCPTLNELTARVMEMQNIS